MYCTCTLVLSSKRCALLDIWSLDMGLTETAITGLGANSAQPLVTQKIQSFTRSVEVQCFFDILPEFQVEFQSIPQLLYVVLSTLLYQDDLAFMWLSLTTYTLHEKIVWYTHLMLGIWVLYFMTGSSIHRWSSAESHVCASCALSKSQKCFFDLTRAKSKNN